MLFCKSCFQSGFLVLITRLAQQGEHILFIALYARLVKGIDAHQIAGNSAGLFKEINQITQLKFSGFLHMQHHAGSAAVSMGQHVGSGQVFTLLGLDTALQVCI